MKVSIIILNWNRKEDTLSCMKSLKESRIKDFELEIIVVDNGSTDGSQQTVARYIKEAKKVGNRRWKLIELEENTGFVKGNNVGIKYALDAGADYIILLNNDTIVEQDCISNLVGYANKHKDIGLISPKIYFAKGFEFHKARYKDKDLGKVFWYAGGDIDWNNVYGSNHGVDEVDEGQYDKTKETDFATGCCILIRREVLDKIGLLDKRYFAYYEDSDLSQRARKAGWKVVYYPFAHLWHKVAQSSGIGSGLNDYFTTRNRLLFGIRYVSLRTKFALIRESLKHLLIGRKWQKIGARDFYLGRFGKGSWK